MKTSNYILIGFLSFITIMLVNWHVDSKYYETEYDRKEEIRKSFYSSKRILEKDINSVKKRNHFIDKAKAYFEYKERSFYQYRSSAELLNQTFKIFKDTSNLLFAKQLAKNAYDKRPTDRQANYVYGSILENLGIEEKAKTYIEFAKKLDSIEGYKLEEYRNDKGEIMRVRKLIDTTAIFEYEEYKNQKGDVIRVKKQIK